MKSHLFLILASYSFIKSPTMAFEDGDLYKIVSPLSGNVLTVGSSQPSEGAEIILTSWKNEPNQKWLAVQAVVAGDNYLLMPQQQRWDWSRFLRNGEALRETKERHNDLPDWSMVLNADTKGQVTQQPRDSKKYQQWRSEVVSLNSGSKRVIIKNLLDNKCLQAHGGSSSPTGTSQTSTTPTTASNNQGFFRRISSWFSSTFGSGSSSANTATTTTTARPIPASAVPSGTNASSNKIVLANCDPSNSGQQWALEKLSIR